MPRRNQTRRLWLQVKVYAPNTSAKTVKDVLIDSILKGDYRYPRGWKVGIYWRNKEMAPMRSGEFTREMQASRQSSLGFDDAVIEYLENARLL